MAVGAGTRGHGDEPVAADAEAAGDRGGCAARPAGTVGPGAGEAGEAWQEYGLVFTTSLGTGYESHNLRRDFRRVTAAAGLGVRWVPKELRTSFVSMMSYQGVPVEEIARLAGHASSRTTEVIYRRELRPVITTGAEVMDQIFRPKQRRGSATAAG